MRLARAIQFILAGLLFWTLCPAVAFASPRTEGEKTLLYIRAVFPDNTESPVTDEYITNVLNQMNEYVKVISRGKMSLPFTLTPPLMLPKTSEEYHKGNWTDGIRADARIVAKAAGFDTEKFDYEIVLTRSQFGSGGVGGIGAKGLGLSNHCGLGLTAHELGHNFGMPHPQLRSSNDDDIMGEWQNSPYGVSFDPVGGGGTDDFPTMLLRPYSARSKFGLGWLADEEVTRVEKSGSFQIYAHDIPDQSLTTPKALDIPQGNGLNWWVEMRRAMTDKAPIMNGVLIYLTHERPGMGTELIDMTPGSPDGSWDSPLLVGQTFANEASGVYITVLGKQTEPWSFADEVSNQDPKAAQTVVVNRGKFPDNHAPQVSVASERDKVAVGKPATLKVWATDPDGDEMTYFWDFGDGTVAGGLPKMNKVWTYPGEFRVRCTVTDMKGGQTSKSTLVMVTSASIVKKQYKISGRVTAGGKPVADARVYFSKDDWSPTDSDGAYVLPGLAAGTYGLEVRKHGYRFFPDGFTNPVGCPPNAEKINFSGEVRPALPAKVASFSEIADLKRPSSFALVSPAAGEKYLFVRGKDDALWVRTAKDDVWSDWTSLGGILTSSPRAASWSEGRIDIFARSGPQVMLHKYIEKGTWSGWERMDAVGPADGDIAVSSWGLGRLDLFARGFDNGLWHASYSGKWSEWELLDGKLAGDPAAVSRKENSIDVMANSFAGTGLGLSWDGTNWGDRQEEPLPKEAEKGFVVAASGPGRLEVFTRTKKGDIWHQSSDATWTPWHNLGGELNSLPGVRSPKAGEVEVIGARGGELVRKVFNGVWSGWEVVK